MAARAFSTPMPSARRNAVLTNTVRQRFLTMARPRDGDGSSACQWVQSAKCEARQSGQPLADRESPTCGVVAWHPTAASARSHPTAVEGNGLRDGLLRRNDRMAGSGVAEGFGRKALGHRLRPERRCWWGQVRRAIPSWPLRRRHCRGGGSSGSQREAPRP